jgi:hypothetical protein
VVTEQRANKNSRWAEQELTSLGQLCSVGMPVDHIAKFLRRDLKDVKDRASALYFRRACGNVPMTSLGTVA